MEDYSPRRHDSVVEPLFGGLQSEPPREVQAPVERPLALWAFIAFCAALVALRIATR